MEILNYNERQGKSLEEIESSAKIFGFSLIFLLILFAYTSYTKQSKAIQQLSAEKTAMQLVKNQ
jgi:cell division protein FtsB